jgi:hypothetical protein
MNYRKNVIEPFNSVIDEDLVATDSEASNLVIQDSKSPEKSSQEKQDDNNVGLEILRTLSDYQK